ncbi:MAG TPA: hypothetical protein VHC41_04025 [Mycobacteriales bacterium]|nr:hypothetical protein [Mycobacteriales bacterium]
MTGVTRPNAGPDPGTLTLAWAAIAFGISRQHGDYSPSALGLIVAGWLLAYLGIAARVRVPTTLAFAAAALVVADAALQAGPANHGHGVWYALSRICAYPAAAATLLALRWRRAFGIALGLLMLTGLLRILATPTPPIDVHFLLTDSTRGLIHGLDMYRQSWPGSDGLQNEYPYLPWTSVLLLPAWLVTHEVRVGLLAAIAVAAIALHRLAGPGPARWSAFAPLMVASYPLFAYQIQQSWTEPLLIALLALLVLATERGRTGWAIVALALALATKQHIVLLLPLAALWPAFGWRRTAIATGLGFGLVLPWLIAGPRDFWDDAVLLNVHYPVLQRALDVPALADRHGLTLGFGVTVAVVLVGYALAVFRLPRDAAGFAAGGGLVQLGLDVFNKQSFFNHYTLVMGLFAIALVATRLPGRSVAAGKAGERGALEDAAV